MSKINYEQGLYLYDGTLVYLAYHPVVSKYYIRVLKLGSYIGGYSYMECLTGIEYKSFNNLHTLIPLKLGWMSNETVVSNLYPEYFIWLIYIMTHLEVPSILNFRWDTYTTTVKLIHALQHYHLILQRLCFLLVYMRTTILH